MCGRWEGGGEGEGMENKTGGKRRQKVTTGAQESEPGDGATQSRMQEFVLKVQSVSQRRISLENLTC